MSTPGFVPRQDKDLADRVIKIERRIRDVQRNVAGATVANGGAALSSATPQPIGTAAGGAATSSSRADHVHSSALASQTDVALASPVSGQGLVWNGSKWANQALNYVSTTNLPMLVSGGGLGDYLRWADQISTIPRMAAVGAAGGIQTLGAVWPLPTGTSYSFTGFRYGLTTAATGTASIGVYVGAAVNNLTLQGTAVTQSVTTGTNGIYQAAYSGAVAVNSASTQYVGLLISFSVAQTVSANASSVTANAPWQTGAMWAGTATGPTTIVAVWNASTPVSTVAPWMALY